MRIRFFFSLTLLLLFAYNCQTIQVVPIPTQPRDRVERIVPREEIPEEEPPPTKPEPAIIKLMRDDLEKASDFVEEIIRGSKKNQGKPVLNKNQTPPPPPPKVTP